MNDRFVEIVPDTFCRGVGGVVPGVAEGDAPDDEAGRVEFKL